MGWPTIPVYARPRRERRIAHLLLLLAGLAALLQGTGCGAPQAEPPKIRNLLLISLDTTRADHLGCYGYPAEITPNIDALARNGTLFRHAVAPSPSTLPSHSTLLTGTNPTRHGVHDNDGYKLGDDQLTLAEILREQGFVTSAVVGAFVMGRAFGLGQGFEHFDDDFTAGRRDDA